MFYMCFIALQKAPFRHAKRPISGAEKHHIAPWNGLSRTAKRAISEREVNLSGLCYGVYQRAICPEPASDIPDLTSIHISFAKIFCQNLVKKNCKYVARVFAENVSIMWKKEDGKNVPFSRWLFVWLRQRNLLFQKRFIGRTSIRQCMLSKGTIT